MAKVPDVCIVNFWRLTAAEIKYFVFSCARRNDIDGGFEIDDQWVVRDMRMSRSRVTEARNELEKKGWIKIMYVRGTKYYIAPFFGFVVENSTYLDEISTKRVENSTRPLKELPAKLPAKLREEGTADAAPHARQAQPDENSKSQSAGKPAVAAPAKKRKRKSSAPRPPAKQKPADVRINHPAVQMVKNITKRFPPKDKWDRIIREIGNKRKIGDKPITDFFRECWEEWRGYGGDYNNLNEWLFKPNITGKLPPRFERNGFGNGSGKLPDVPKNPPENGSGKRDRIAFDERILKIHLEDFRVENLSDEELNSLEENYTSEAWAWLMENLKNG